MATRPRHRAVAERPAAGDRRLAGLRRVIAAWPTGYDVKRYAQEHGLDFEDITRDIVRIATIAHLLDTGVLDEDFVLTGGMALRLRGSNRFTIKDTDSSLRGRLDELEARRKLRLDTDQLQVYPDSGTNWGREPPSSSTSSRSTTRPTSLRSPATQSRASSPSRSANAASSNGPSGSRCHPYPELVIEPSNLEVPVMDIAEQAAEKVVGWAAGSLIKHYLDLAWIGRELGETLIAEDFQRLVQRKLDVGFETFPGVYSDLREIKDLLIPLHRPREWQGPLNKAGEPTEHRSYASWARRWASTKAISWSASASSPSCTEWTRAAGEANGHRRRAGDITFKDACYEVLLLRCCAKLDAGRCLVPVACGSQRAPARGAPVRAVLRAGGLAIEPSSTLAPAWTASTPGGPPMGQARSTRDGSPKTGVSVLEASGPAARMQDSGRPRSRRSRPAGRRSGIFEAGCHRQHGHTGL